MVIGEDYRIAHRDTSACGIHPRRRDRGFHRRYELVAVNVRLFPAEEPEHKLTRIIHATTKTADTLSIEV